MGSVYPSVAVCRFFGISGLALLVVTLGQVDDDLLYNPPGRRPIQAEASREPVQARHRTLHGGPVGRGGWLGHPFTAWMAALQRRVTDLIPIMAQGCSAPDAPTP